MYVLNICDDILCTTKKEEIEFKFLVACPDLYDKSYKMPTERGDSVKMRNALKGK